MKQVCLTCAHVAPSGSLFCQEVACPAERAPAIFGYGTWIGDITLVRPVTVLPSATIYEAQRQQQRMYVSLAHPGIAHAERLKREAALLRDLQVRGRGHPCLPVWVPPSAGATSASEPFGHAMIGDEQRHYVVFEYQPGESLRALLRQHPRLSTDQIGWMLRDLTGALAVLQSRGWLNCALSPEAILVGIDEHTSAPQLLLAHLGLASRPDRIVADWYPDAVSPAYTAPELADQARQAGYPSDVYGLGLLLSELLSGKPALPFEHKPDSELYRMVAQGRRVPLTHTEDSKALAAIATQATDRDPTARPASVAALAKQLAPYISAPRTRRSWRLSLEGVLMLVAGLLVLTFLIAVGFTLLHALSAR